MTLALLAATLTASAETTAPTAGVNRADMDLSVAPGEDFYEYAGGGWRKANPLKPEYSSYGVFDDLAEMNLWARRLPTSTTWLWTATG